MRWPLGRETSTDLGRYTAGKTPKALANHVIMVIGIYEQVARRNPHAERSDELQSKMPGPL
jgi:hypothetical protein